MPLEEKQIDVTKDTPLESSIRRIIREELSRIEDCGNKVSAIGGDSDLVDITDNAKFNNQFAYLQSDAPPCPDCGSITVRNGNCYLCHNCGNSLGCS